MFVAVLSPDGTTVYQRECWTCDWLDALEGVDRAYSLPGADIRERRAAHAPHCPKRVRR